jgi:hypothetical protein
MKLWGCRWHPPPHQGRRQGLVYIRWFDFGRAHSRGLRFARSTLMSFTSELCRHTQFPVSSFQAPPPLPWPMPWRGGSQRAGACPHCSAACVRAWCWYAMVMCVSLLSVCASSCCVCRGVLTPLTPGTAAPHAACTGHVEKTLAGYRVSCWSVAAKITPVACKFILFALP